MPEEPIMRRAAELEETGKGRAISSSAETVMTQSSSAAKSTAAVTETRALCRICMQEKILPPGQTEWRCEVCGTLNRI